MDHLSRLEGGEGESRSMRGAEEGTPNNWIQDLLDAETKNLPTSLYVLGGSPHGEFLELTGEWTV